MGLHREAIEYFTMAIDADPMYVWAYTERSVSSYKAKLYDQAWSDVEMCRKLGHPAPAEFIAKLSDALSHQE